jgi:hypothetical protein
MCTEGWCVSSESPIGIEADLARLLPTIVEQRLRAQSTRPKSASPLARLAD